MRIEKLFRRSIVFAGALFIIFGCNTLMAGSTSTPAPTATPEPPPIKIGHWEGDPGISFDVMDDGKINNLKLEMGDCKVAYNDDFTVDADGNFVAGSVDADGNLNRSSLKGNFDTLTTVTGELSGIWQCGSPTFHFELHLPSSLLSWQAEWKGP